MATLIEKIRHWSRDRQLLGKQGNTALEVLEATIGVYSPHPTTALSLHARMKSFSTEAVQQLDQERLALRIPSMRGSVYILPKAMAGKIFSATLPPAGDISWTKRYTQTGRDLPVDLAPQWKAEVLAFLDTPKEAKEIKKAMDIPPDKLKALLNWMAYERQLLRVGSPSLRSNIISYVATESWVGDALKQESEAESLAFLAGEYVRAFGPVRIRDFKWWAGVTLTKAKAAFSELPTVDIGNELLLLKEDVAAFESYTLPASDSLDLLPQWDCYTMGYAPDGRERLVHPAVQDQAYGALGATGGNAIGTVLVNGQVLGAWKSRFKGTAMEVDLNIFEKPTVALSTQIEARFSEISGVLKAKKVVIKEGK